MATKKQSITAHKIARYLDKNPRDFTKKDIVRYIKENNIEMVNFRYVAHDGRLKTLGFVISDEARLDRFLSFGERVDGSSLFSFIDAASSDLYAIPRFRTAYVNPFADRPTLDLLCSYYTSDGTPLSSSPENVLRKAQQSLKDATGMTMDAMGELEYYTIYPKESLYPATAQRGYHESAPFAKWEKLRLEAVAAIAQAGGQIKYSHSEVGYIRGDETEMAQHEIEFLPVPAEEAADQLVVAKWMLNMIGYRNGVTISFAPKISAGHAGSGMHIHTRLMKNGKNMMVDGGKLSDTARKAIAGYLSLSSSLTAFGNQVPTSYLRLVPHQEAPTNICWGDRNRSVLVRVPLGWLNADGMVNDANPLEPKNAASGSESQTVEFRCADGSANPYLLIAGLCVAARHGLQTPDALEMAKKLYVDVNIFHAEHKNVLERLSQLPISCFDSADCLLKDRAVYEKDGVFSPLLLDRQAAKLKAFNDHDLSERLFGKEDEIRKLVKDYLYC